MKLNEILTPSFRALRDLTQKSRKSQIFSGSPTAQNLKKILMKILLTKTRKTLSTWLRLRLCCCSVMLVLQASLQPEPASTPTIPMGFQPGRKKNQDYRFSMLNSQCLILNSYSQRSENTSKFLILNS